MKWGFIIDTMKSNSKITVEREKQEKSRRRIKIIRIKIHDNYK